MKKFLLATLLLATVSVTSAQTWTDTFDLVVTKIAIPGISNNTVTITVLEGETDSGSLLLTNGGNVVAEYDLISEIDSLFTGYTPSLDHNVLGWENFGPLPDAFDAQSQFNMSPSSCYDSRGIAIFAYTDVFDYWANDTSVLDESLAVGTNSSFAVWKNEASAAMDIGFEFPFYYQSETGSFKGDAVSYTNFSAGLHGGIVLGGGFLPPNPHGNFEYFHDFFDNAPFGFVSNSPSVLWGNFLVADHSNPVIAPFWSVFSNPTTDVRYRKEADKLIVSWEGMNQDITDGGTDLEFQMHLYPDGTIRFFYKNIDGALLDQATAGLQTVTPYNPAREGFQRKPSTFNADNNSYGGFANNVYPAAQNPGAYYSNTPLLPGEVYQITETPTFDEWLTVSQTEGAVGKAGTQLVTFNVDTTNQDPGTYNFPVQIVWSDGTTNTVALSVVVQAKTPTLNVPTPVSFSGFAGDVTKTNVTISNTGTGPLGYSIFDSAAQAAGYSVTSNAPYSWDGMPADNSVVTEIRPVATDSDELDENEVGLLPSPVLQEKFAGTFPLSDEGFTDLLPIGFEFPFYGMVFTNLSIGVNGGISLGEAWPMLRAASFTGYDGRVNRWWRQQRTRMAFYSLADNLYDGSSFAVYAQNNMIMKVNTPNSVYAKMAADQLLAPYWSDLSMVDTSRIYLTYYADRLVITWEHMLDKYASNGGSDETFQVILYPDGTIRYQYDNLTGVDFRHGNFTVPGENPDYNATYRLGPGVGLRDTTSRVIDLQDFWPSDLTSEITATTNWLLLPNGMPSDVFEIAYTTNSTTTAVSALDDYAYEFMPNTSNPMLYIDSSAFGTLQPGESQVIMVVGDASDATNGMSAATTFTFNSDGGNKNMAASFSVSDPFSVADDVKDSDNDGQSDAAERMAGTDVNDAESVFRTNVDGSRTLSWPAPTGAYASYDREYTIEYTTSLTAGWQHLATVTNVNEFTDTVNVNEPQIFYKVTVTVMNP